MDHAYRENGELTFPKRQKTVKKTPNSGVSLFGTVGIIFGSPQDIHRWVRDRIGPNMKVFRPETAFFMIFGTFDVIQRNSRDIRFHRFSIRESIEILL